MKTMSLIALLIFAFCIQAQALSIVDEDVPEHSVVCAQLDKEVEEIPFDQDYPVAYQTEVRRVIQESRDVETYGCGITKLTNLRLSYPAGDNTSAKELFAALDQFYTKVSLEFKDGKRNDYCHWSQSSSHFHEHEGAIVTYGTLLCHSFELDTLKKHDFPSFIREATKGTLLDFEMEGIPMPSGTAIHN